VSEVHNLSFAKGGRSRSLTTEITEATEAGNKGFRIQVRTLPFSVFSVTSVVKSGADVGETMGCALSMPRPL